MTDEKGTKPTNYSIGPFNVDEKRGVVVFAPGRYVLSKPITVGLHGEMHVEGLHYEALADGDTNAAIGEYAAADSNAP